MSQPSDDGNAERAHGTQIGDYVLGRKIGSGAMATVYEARHRTLGHPVAVKALHPHLAGRYGAAQRMAREGRAVARLQHPNIVKVLESGEESNAEFLVMELLRGADLRAHLAGGSGLALSDVLDIVLPVISAIAASHDAGIVHRDLKPANVFLHRPIGAPGFCPKVLDFGVAKVDDPDEMDELTSAETTLGTVPYMAPEQVRAARDAAPESDQYALGVLLYESATGRRPFEGEGWYDVMHAILTGVPMPPSTHRPELPPEFDAIVTRALARDPAERFPSVRALGSALLELSSPMSAEEWGDDFSETGDRVPRSGRARRGPCVRGQLRARVS